MQTDEPPPVMQVQELDLTESQLHGMTLSTMRQLGGGFASKLAAAWLAADHESSTKLIETFPDLYDRYRRIALGISDGH